MDTWMNAIGVIGFGVFYGYVLMYVLKRYLPPVSQTPPQIKELILSIGALIGGGAIGTLVTSIDGVNYIAAYGFGLPIGGAANVAITIWFGLIHRNKTNWDDNE